MMNRTEVILALEEIRDPDFLFAKGYLNAAGIDLSAGHSDARQLLERRANSGESEAQFVFAKLLLSGLVGAVDQEAALAWCQRAVQQEYPPALALLSAFHSQGWAGLKKNPGEAIRLLKRAAEADYPHAMILLGIAYLNGIGAPKDRALGLKYLQQAADLGNGEAQGLLKGA